METFERDGTAARPRPSFGGACRLAASAAVLLCAAGTAGAQEGGTRAAAAASVGPALLDGEFGVEAAAGVELSRGRMTAGLRGVEFALVPGEAEPGHRWERLADGQRRCREVATGRFAADTRCVALAAALSASAEAFWTAAAPGGRPVRIGAGLRVGDSPGPYGAVRWGPVPRVGGGWHLRASAGPSLLRVAFGGKVPL